MYKNLPRALVITGLVFLFLAAALLAYSQIDDYLAGQRSRTLLERIKTESAPVARLAEEDIAKEPARASLVPGDPAESVEPDAASPAPKTFYDTAGVLTIPKLGLELPVLSECNENSLKVSICLYTGDADKLERLIVAGHNYKSHFGYLSRLVPGDEVYFTNSAGIKKIYTVTELTEIDPNGYIELMTGKWDVTLLTCNDDWSTRILARCSAAQS